MEVKKEQEMIKEKEIVHHPKKGEEWKNNNGKRFRSRSHSPIRHKELSRKDIRREDSWEDKRHYNNQSRGSSSLPPPQKSIPYVSKSMRETDDAADSPKYTKKEPKKTQKYRAPSPPPPSDYPPKTPPKKHRQLTKKSPSPLRRPSWREPENKYQRYAFSFFFFLPFVLLIKKNS